MRDENDRGRRAEERIAEVVDERDREVVGRLVEQQHRRSAQQDAGERDASALPDREPSDHAE